MFYDHDGNAIDFDEWNELFYDTPGRRVAQDRIGDWHISTVWLGVDHSLGSEHPPLIYETQVFRYDENEERNVEINWRYSTRQAAARGHAAVVNGLENNWPFEEMIITERDTQDG